MNYKLFVLPLICAAMIAPAVCVYSDDDELILNTKFANIDMRYEEYTLYDGYELSAAVKYLSEKYNVLICLIYDGNDGYQYITARQVLEYINTKKKAGTNRQIYHTYEFNIKAFNKSLDDREMILRPQLVYTENHVSLKSSLEKLTSYFANYQWKYFGGSNNYLLVYPKSINVDSWKFSIDKTILNKRVKSFDDFYENTNFDGLSALGEVSENAKACIHGVYKQYDRLLVIDWLYSCAIKNKHRWQINYSSEHKQIKYSFAVD